MTFQLQNSSLPRKSIFHVSKLENSIKLCEDSLELQEFQKVKSVKLNLCQFLPSWSFQRLEISGRFECLPSFGRKRPQNPANQESGDSEKRPQKPSKRPQKHARNRNKNKTPKTLKKPNHLYFLELEGPGWL